MAKRKQKPVAAKSAGGFKSLESILTASDSPIDIKEVAYQLMNLVGGAAGLAILIKEEYNASEAGSLARTRALDIMVKMLQIAAPKDGVEDTSYLTDEDLAEIARDELRRMGVTDPGWITHVCI